MTVVSFVQCLCLSISLANPSTSFWTRDMRWREDQRELLLDFRIRLLDALRSQHPSQIRRVVTEYLSLYQRGACGDADPANGEAGSSGTWGGAQVDQTKSQDRQV